MEVETVAVFRRMASIVTPPRGTFADRMPVAYGPVGLRALSAYEAVRAHELMLNEAVSRFEHARLGPLIALNGGAVVAFLTLLGALLGKDRGRHPNLWLSGLAVGA